MDTLNNLVNKITSWIDSLFGFGTYYTVGYSKYIMYAVMLFVLSKLLKVKVDVSAGKSGK